MNISFWGSTTFSLAILIELLKKHKEGKLNLKYVVSQKAAPFGRKKVLSHNPVAQYCIDNNIKLFTPEKLSKLELLSSEELETDLSLVAAYGKIISEKILQTAKHGFMNFHGSILPKYRGAIPVQKTILNQDKTGGITVIKMDKGMDTGDVISKYPFPVNADMTSGELMDELGKLSALKINTDFDYLFSPTKWKLEKQDDSQATTCFVKEFSKEKLEIYYSDSLSLAHGKVMSANPQPIAWANLKLKGKESKVNFIVSKLSSNDNLSFPKNNELSLHAIENKLFLELESSFLEIIKIQPTGKNIIDAKSFINGYL